MSSVSLMAVGDRVYVLRNNSMSAGQYRLKNKWYSLQPGKSVTSSIMFQSYTKNLTFSSYTEVGIPKSAAAVSSKKSKAVEEPVVEEKGE